MEVISSSSFPKLHQSFSISSLQIENNPLPKVSSNPLFTAFQPITKLITQTDCSFPSAPTIKEETELRRCRRRRRSLFAEVFNFIDDHICTYVDSPLPPYLDPKQVLSGWFAPVDELPPTACEVIEGTLPSCLNGAYIRNGPNPQFVLHGPYHLLDGDGMLHCIKISQGNATFCSRYVKTYKYKIEHEMGYPFVPSPLSSFSVNIVASLARFLPTVAPIVTGKFDPVTNGCGMANTSVVQLGGFLFALMEGDLPYAVKVTSDGDIITIGRHDFHSNEPFFNMTAHPKIDPSTGEIFAYRYNIQHPFLTFFRISPDGKKQADVHIHSIEKLTVIHDFALTETYAVFPDTQLTVNPMDVLHGRLPLGVDHTKVQRLGIIPRHAENDSKMQWIDAEGLNILHVFNAWEEDYGDTIQMIFSNSAAADKLLENLDLAELHLEKITVNLKNKAVKRRRLSGKNLDLGTINSTYAGKKNRYIYAGILGPSRMEGVVKLDLSLSEAGQGDCTVASRLYGRRCCGGEPFFVAKDPNNPAAEEDEGYLVMYIYDEENNQSKFIVMDAKSPTLDIVAEVKLPQMVPVGFHGMFVPESQLNLL